MKNVVKYLIFALALGFFLCVTALVRMQVREHRHLTTCKKVEIIFKDTLNFVSEDDVRACLKKNCQTLLGQRIDSLRLHEIEKVLDERSAIRSAQAWTADSTLFISISQREPVARLETSSGPYYIDGRGFVFPVQGSCTKRFPVVKGELPLHEPQQMLDFLAHMRKNKWEERISSISVSPSGMLTLVPEEGKEHFIFGRSENIEEKFGKMNEYYKRIKPAVEEGLYSSVNVQYKGQIICRK